RAHAGAAGLPELLGRMTAGGSRPRTPVKVGVAPWTPRQHDDGGPEGPPSRRKTSRGLTPRDPREDWLREEGLLRRARQQASERAALGARALAAGVQLQQLHQLAAGAEGVCDRGSGVDLDGRPELAADLGHEDFASRWERAVQR